MTLQNPTCACECFDCGDTPLSGREVCANCLRDPLPRRAPALPTDSAERKRTPLCTGLLDYFPAALTAVGETDLERGPEADPDEVPEYLRDRDYPMLANAALRLLQIELTYVSPSVNGSVGLSALFDDYSAALAAVAQVSWHGNEKHNPGLSLHHARGKSMDHADCILRHYVQRGGFDGALRHSACLAWRALALLQEHLESLGAPLARGAVLP